MIVFNQQMKKDFQRYGDMVSFDLTFSLVKGKHPSGLHWKLGSFLGVSSAKHLVPLGLVLTIRQTQQVYSQIFSTFFKAMGGCPSVIVTDQQKAMRAALQQLKTRGVYSGFHFLDGFHILKNVRKVLSEKEHLFYFKKMIHSKTQASFDWWLQRARTNLCKEQKPVLERFTSRCQLYCFSKLPKVFFGFSASSSSNESFHNLIKTAQPSQKPFSITLLTVLGCIEQLQRKKDIFLLETTRYEHIFRIYELEAIRHCLSKPVLSQLLEELAKSIQTEIYESGRYNTIQYLV